MAGELFAPFPAMMRTQSPEADAVLCFLFEARIISSGCWMDQLTGATLVCLNIIGKMILERITTRTMTRSKQFDEVETRKNVG